MKCPLRKKIVYECEEIYRPSIPKQTIDIFLDCIEEKCAWWDTKDSKCSNTIDNGHHIHWWIEESKSNPVLRIENGRRNWYATLILRCKYCNDIIQREVKQDK